MKHRTDMDTTDKLRMMKTKSPKQNNLKLKSKMSQTLRRRATVTDVNRVLRFLLIKYWSRKGVIVNYAVIKGNFI